MLRSGFSMREQDKPCKLLLVGALLLAFASAANVAGQSPAAASVSTQSKTGEYRYTNRLIHAKSPYLLLHAHNPVDWYPWGDDAFEKARKEDKPIFLSIGYFTCHWCHVMEKESYSDPSLASILNQYFVSIKVDREERPDIDRLYIAYVEATDLAVRHCLPASSLAQLAWRGILDETEYQVFAA